MAEGQSSIAIDVLARYASDAAGEIEGVRGLAGRRGARVDESGRVELRLDVAWGTPIPTLGRRVQERVREYLQQMAELEAAEIDVVVERIGPAR